MINNSFLQFIVSGGMLTTMAGVLFASGKVVSKVEHLEKSINKLENRMDSIDQRLRVVETDLKDVRSKVTVLWEQRNVI